MTKVLLSLLVIFTVTCVWSGRYDDKWSDENTNNFPDNEFSRLLNDIWKNIKLDKMIDTIGSYLRTAVRDGQLYRWEDFQKDLSYLKQKPSSFFSFMRQVTWSAIVHSCIKVVKLFTQIQNFLLKFLKNKCDEYIGSDEPLHPWNIMMQQDKQQVSFFLFIYGIGLSLILVKLLSWWNFMLYAAISFLVYSLGGPYLVFKWLLCITALFWFVFEMLLQYPMQFAAMIILLYALSYVKGIFAYINTARSKYVPRQTAAQTTHLKTAPPPNDLPLNILTTRIDGMERKTDLLQDKLEKLSITMERIIQSDKEEE